MIKPCCLPALLSWATVCLLGGSLASGAAPADLPSESTLPEAMAPQPATLPAESTLPPAYATDPRPHAGADLQTQAEAEHPTLPDQGASPPEAGPGAPRLAGQLPLAGSPDMIPWLRLDLNGHSGPIRSVQFLADNDRLCTAGDDKSVLVWRRDPRDPAKWRYERTVRWQIQRGTRGRIYAMAAAGRQLALAGHGAMGGVGEIILVDPATGDYAATLFDEAQGHRQVVVALNHVATPEGGALASLSMDGRTLLWRVNQRGVWQARVAQRDDRASGRAAELADRLMAARSFSGVVAVNSREVIVGAFNRAVGTRLAWHLERIDVQANARQRLGGSGSPLHVDSVACLATDAQRTRLVSVDGVGRVFLWDLTQSQPTAQQLNRPGAAPVLSTALSANGRWLALGTTESAAGKATLEWWDVLRGRPPRKVSTRTVARHVLACAITDQGTLAAAQSETAAVWQGPDKPTPQMLRGGGELPLRVAFPSAGPPYHLGIGVSDGDGGSAVINRRFDTDQLRLERIASEPARWLPSEGAPQGWKIDQVRASDGRVFWQLFEQGAARCRLPLNAVRTGGYRTACWLPGAEANAMPQVAVGTSAGEIYLFAAVREGEAPVLRRWRGHSSAIKSLAASRDRRWLASASDDSTVRVWPLERPEQLSAMQRRWGAEFAVDDAGQLRIGSIREEGPLYFRGARVGDQVVACRWQDAGQRTTENDPRRLIEALAEAPWDRLVDFELRSGRQAARRFQILPAWQQMASLTIDRRGEWAYWTPSGFYDASFEGHRLFGWQINRGLDELPDFFLAAQFRAVLERPDVLSGLLRAGSLEKAFREARAEAPGDASQTLTNAYRLKPEVTIVPVLDPEGQPVLRDDLLTARVRVPAGQRLARIKAFASGVVAPAGTVVEQQTAGDDQVLTYQWKLKIPSQPRVLLEVIAATDAQLAATDALAVANRTPPSQKKPTLTWFSAAIDDYRDAQIPKLRTPVAHASELTELIRRQGPDLYRVEATALANDQVTRPGWAFLTRYHAERLRRTAGPDDVLVFYLSGHGVQDPDGDQYHFVTADVPYREIMDGRYANCLSFGELAQFADVSCRKLVILDTCHAGAIQPMRHRELKRAVRALQDDLLITFSASLGAEEAVEGRFSAAILAALRGAADREGGDGDGVVTLDEFIAYVQHAVDASSRQEQFQQTPSAGPTDLLPYLTLPLAKAEPRQPGEPLGQDGFIESLRSFNARLDEPATASVRIGQ